MHFKIGELGTEEKKTVEETHSQANFNPVIKIQKKKKGNKSKTWGAISG